MVTLLTYGTRGDVEPFVALASRLRSAGVSVSLAAPEAFRELIEESGAAFYGLPGDPRALAGSLVDRAGASVPRMVTTMAGHVKQIALEALRVIEDACRGADCIVHSFLMTASGHQHAVANRVPEISAQLFPVFSTTDEFPGPTFPDLPLGPVYRRLTHVINAQVYWQGSRLLYGWVRRQRRGLPRLPGYPFARSTQPPVPILYAFSPAVVPRPRDWPARSIMTGYWFREPAAGWHPPAHVARFLEAGAPPVYVGLGSMVGRDWAAVVRECGAALAQAGLRGVLAIGPEAAFELPPNMIAVGDLPHAWLFPRLAAVVHHGGAGTTGAALRAGRPSLILPLTADQGFWARRVLRLGAAAALLRKRHLVDDLRAGLRRLREDASIERRALEVGQQMAGEDGAGRAVDEILRLVGVHS